ncbi:hypothetical protein EUTSA_v10017687mg, partial [Eutrema salsugineum]
MTSIPLWPQPPIQLLSRCSFATVMSAAVIEGNDAVTSHIISTTIGGKNSEPKQLMFPPSTFYKQLVTWPSGLLEQDLSELYSRIIAIKKVLQDWFYKNHELQLMRIINHPNVVSLKHCFFSTTSRDELFLNLVMEYVPETLYRILKHYTSMHCYLPQIFLIFKGLAYIHTAPGVCHRDVKPHNLLVNPFTHQCNLCDFGSAKVLVKGEPNISYICFRYYRDPELIFGAT